MAWRVPRRSRRASRGQAEVIGGLIVLTLIFMFAVPMLLGAYYSTQKSVETAKLEATRRTTALNERISIQAIDPNSELAIRAGWIPGIFINNTGTVDVTLDKLYLIDIANNTIFAVFDLRYARPGINPLIEEMLIDVDPAGLGSPPPPTGVPIVLKPGQNLLIVFNETILPYASMLAVRVESASGVLHPLTSAGQGDVQLYPGRPGADGGIGREGAWRGIFAPQSGFQLRGATELLKAGEAYAWVPPIYVYPDIDVDEFYEPVAVDYKYSFIYEDPLYPGLYYIKIKVEERFALWVIRAQPGTEDRSRVWIFSGYIIELRGFVGTYDPGGVGTYFNGYAFAVRVYNALGNLLYKWPEDWGYSQLDPVMLNNDDSITVMDFDGNGIEEVTFYSHLNGPLIDEDFNNDADRTAIAVANDDLHDALVWTYLVSRDISDVDFIRVTVKVNYYWTATTAGFGCPDWDYRDLKIFAIAVFKYDPASGEWRVHQYQNFGYTSEKPVQFQPTVTFPVSRDGIYRIGIMFYDNYRDWDAYWLTYCFIDFTMTVEHIIVEYGVVNPLFRESPPLYIVAIPDPALIEGLGEADYLNATPEEITLDEAKVRAQAELLAKIEEELNYAGVAGYTIINDTDTLYNLLFGGNPPKYAIIIWLQGSVRFSDVLAAYGVDETTVAAVAAANSWLIVWAAGEPLGDRDLTLVYFNGLVEIDFTGPYNMTLTDTGLKARREFYAFYLYNEVYFNYTSYNLTSACVVDNSLFYWDPNSVPVVYGTVAYWIDCAPGTGAVLLNPVHVDWDITFDGALPETVAQQVVYAALYAWQTLRYG